ncbi:MAG: efflux RND transporter periplasmic adaptor subunit [Chloroflexi bacterium]|nr:efflux RND transporter periplasmic adaptor subunit [Chloroflexota bacterium]
MKIGSFLKKYWIVILVVIAAVAAGLIWQNSRKAASDSVYQTVATSRGTLTANIGATGTVRAGQSASLTWQTSGRVESVKGSIGDAVKTDDVLASLLQTSMSQNIILAEADLITAQKNLDDLMASKTSLAQAQQSLANAKQAVEDAQEKVDSLSFDRASDNLIQQTQANIDLAKRDVTRAEDNYKLYVKKPEGDSNKAQALLTLTNARQKLTDMTNKYNWYTGKATDLDAEKYRANLAVAQAQEADAQREVDRIKNGPSADDIAAAKARVAAAESTLNQSRIVAPFDGVLTQVEPVPGDMVSPGTTAFRIDDLVHLLVDLQISEVDINNVTEGQPVTITFDAVQGKTYNGIVSKISQAGNSSGSGVNFTVTVALTEIDELVKPGMTAAVNITVRELSNALLVQNRAVRQVNGKRVVYVLKDNKPVAVEIRLGATSDTTSEVAGGDLKEGDLIILNPPSTSGGPFGG